MFSSNIITVHEAIADVQPSEFAAYVKELHNDVDKGFSQQYSALQAHSPQPLPCKAAELDINTNKNRYHNILPCKYCVYIATTESVSQRHMISSHHYD